MKEIGRTLLIFVFGIVVLLQSSTRVLSATTYGFDEVWQRIRQLSPDIKQSEQELQAAKIAHNRSKRHYLPQAQIQMKGFSTNDAGMTLFSNLSERAVNAADFNPATLNDPGFGAFARGSLAMTLPLYQGGLNKATKQATALLATAKEYNQKFMTDFQFANNAVEYALLLASYKNKNSFESLNVELNRFLNDYELESSKNPVGHSGLLGLKALSNRLRASIKQSQAQINTYKGALSQRSGLDPNSWTPRIQDLVLFLKAQFGARSLKKKTTATPDSVKVSQYYAQAMKQYSSIEKSQLLPHLGLFGQTDVNMGSRDIASATTMGGYLQWNILSPTQYGAHKEKQLQASAIESQANAQQQKSRIDYDQSLINIKATHENLGLMRESLSLLIEQTKTTNELYQNGVINILQVVDLLNRRGDLITQIHQAEMQLCLDYAKNYLQGGSGE